MARECKGICKNEYLYGEKVFSQKHLPYKKASWCKKCEVSVRPPSVDKIVVTNPKGQREEFPDKIKVTCPCCWSVCRGGPLSKTKPNEAKRKVVVTLKKDEPKPESKRVKWVKPTDKLTAKYENMIPDLIKIKQMDDEIARLEVQVEYENDPSLRLDSSEAKNIGTIGSFMRGEIDKTLEDVVRERKKLYNKVMKRLSNGNDETEREEG